MTEETTKEKKVWSRYKFKNKFETELFTSSADQPQYKWYQAQTISKGNCGVDAVAIAFHFERSDVVYQKLRHKLANLILLSDLERREAQAASVIKNGTWLEDDQLVRLVLAFDVIPIILDGSYDPAAGPAFERLSEARKEAALARAKKEGVVLPHQHAVFQGAELFATKIEELRARFEDRTRYIVLKHVHRCHWICLGHLAVAEKEEDEGDEPIEVQPFMFEDELPPGLLDLFLASLAL